MWICTVLISKKVDLLGLKAWPWCLGLEEPLWHVNTFTLTCTHQDATVLHVHLHSHPISLSSATESLLSRTLHATPLKVHLDTSMHKHAIHATLLKVHVHTLHVTLLKIHLHLNTRLMLRLTWVSLSSSVQQPERDSGKMHPDETNMRFLRRWEEYKQEQRKTIEKNAWFSKMTFMNNYYTIHLGQFHHDRTLFSPWNHGSSLHRGGRAECEDGWP